jgi:trehalose synthase
LAAYEHLVSEMLPAQLRELARDLRGLRVVHINPTPDGGGVAEILRSLRRSAVISACRPHG